MKRLVAAMIAVLLGSFFFVGIAPASAETELPNCEAESVGAWFPGQGVVRAHTSGSDCKAFLAAYELPPTWNGQGWNKTASPQSLFSYVEVVLTQEAQDFPVGLPKCGGVQVDLVTSVPPETVTYPEGIPGGIVAGQHFSLDDCVTPTPTPTDTPTPTPTDTPTTDKPTPTATPTMTKPDKPSPEKTKPAPVLPHTGGDGLAIAALVALGLVLAGVLLWLRGRD